MGSTSTHNVQFTFMFPTKPINTHLKTLQISVRMITFASVAEKINFPKEEEKILSYWKQIDAFNEAQRLAKGKKEYNFYDGPPFATGLPHYGHILAGTIKVRHLISMDRLI